MNTRSPKLSGHRLIASWNGADYARHSSHQRRWGGDLITDLPLRGDEHILDLGCGDGSLTSRLAEHVPSGFVLGVDAAEGMLEAAQAKTKANLRFVKLDIASIAFDAEFDVIFSNAALHWVHGHGPLLGRIYRALRPGGFVRAQFGCEGNCPVLVDCLRAQMSCSPFSAAFVDFCWPWFFSSLTEYETLLTASPFSDWRVSIQRKDQSFVDADALIGWVDNPCLIPFLQGLPTGLRRPFRDRVVDAMLARCVQPDGKYLERFQRLNLWARRAG